MIDQFHHRLSSIERSLERDNAAPTLPILDYYNLPKDVIPGQIFIGKDDALYWFDGSIWNFTDVTTFNAIGNFPQDPIEGQIVIGKRDNSLCWYSNGAWHGIAGSFARGNTPQDSIDGQLVVGSVGQLCWHSNGDWYCFNPTTTTPILGKLWVDHWDIKTYINGDLAYHAPDLYFLSRPSSPNSVEWMNVYLNSPVTWAFYDSKTNYVIGPDFQSTQYSRHWIKNVYWDGTLLNDFQTNFSGFTNTGWSITAFPAGGNAAHTGSSGGELKVSGSPTYDGIGVTHTMEFDASFYQQQYDNVVILQCATKSQPLLYNPKNGGTTTNFVNTPSISVYPGLGIIFPQGWTLNSGNGRTYNAPGGSVTTGPGLANLPNNTDQLFHHLRYEITYLRGGDETVIAGHGGPYQ